MIPYQLVGKPGPAIRAFDVQLYHEEAFGRPILILDFVKHGVQVIPFLELMTRVLVGTGELHS